MRVPEPDYDIVSEELTTLMMCVELEDYSTIQDTITELTAMAEDGDLTYTAALVEIYQYLENHGTMKPAPEAPIHWMQVLADAGESRYMYNLALRYLKGYGVDRDFSKAAWWMQKAADAGDPDAPSRAELFFRFAEYAEKAKAGDPDAQGELAGTFMSMRGWLREAGPEKDDAEALYWAKKSADGGCAEGMFCMGLLYHHGRGVTQDPAEAFRWYQKGVQLNHPQCILNMGVLYMYGKGVKCDTAKAFSLAEKSAGMGSADAMRTLGDWYVSGTGCKDDIRAALDWWEKSLAIMPDQKLSEKVQLMRRVIR